MERYTRFFEEFLEITVSFLVNDNKDTIIQVEGSGDTIVKPASIGDLEILLKESGVKFLPKVFKYTLDGEKANRFLALFRKF
jgi:hypothetical protein